MLGMFYFSGTGNARNAARWMVDSWRARGEEAEAADLATTATRELRIGPNDVTPLTHYRFWRRYRAPKNPRSQINAPLPPSQ